MPCKDEQGKERLVHIHNSVLKCLPHVQEYAFKNTEKSCKFIEKLSSQKDPEKVCASIEQSMSPPEVEGKNKQLKPCSKITNKNGTMVFEDSVQNAVPELLDRHCGKYISNSYSEITGKGCNFTEVKNTSSCDSTIIMVEQAHGIYRPSETANTTSTTLGIVGAISVVAQTVATFITVVKNNTAAIADAGVKSLINTTTDGTPGQDSLAPSETNEPSYNYNQLVGIYGGLLAGVGLCGVYWSYKNRPRTSIAYSRAYASMLKETNSSSV